MERSTIFNGKTHSKWPFSIAMLTMSRGWLPPLETQLGFQGALQHIPAGMILIKPWLNSTNGQVVHLGLEKLIAEKNPLMSADDQDRGHLEPTQWEGETLPSHNGAMTGCSSIHTWHEFHEFRHIAKFKPFSSSIILHVPDSKVKRLHQRAFSGSEKTVRLLQRKPVASLNQAMGYGWIRISCSSAVKNTGVYWDPQGPSGTRTYWATQQNWTSWGLDLFRKYDRTKGEVLRLFQRVLFVGQDISNL